LKAKSLKNLLRLQLQQYVSFVARLQELTVALQLECCLHEWREGSMKGRPFSAALYRRTYNTINNLIAQIKTDKYHAAKFKAAREAWAQGGW